MSFHPIITYSPDSVFTPVLTLVGGSGNTVPVYSTNFGSYCRIGNRVFVDIYFTGDGGSEGAGTGQINISLPIAASASNPVGDFVCGSRRNGSNFVMLSGALGPSATTIALSRILAGGLSVETGAEQNNASRYIRLQFNYFVD